MKQDPASLSNLNDIIVPPAPSWWPLAVGWYVLGAVLLVWVFRLAWRALKRHQLNRYRREALAELALLEAGQPNDLAARLPALLKRTALHVFPRQQIASMSGEAWIAFLNQHCAARPFAGETAELLERLAYGSKARLPEDLQPLFAGVRTWIEQHQAEPC